MPHLVRDGYLAGDDIHGTDLATGESVRLDRLPTRAGEDLSPVVELLDAGQEGRPRWVVLPVRSAAEASALTRRAAGTACRRGFVPILVSIYERLSSALDLDLADRALLLIGGFAAAVGPARAALVDAAARTPRPHLLLTFQRTDAAASGGLVREARAVYGASPASGRPGSSALSGDVVRHLERAARAEGFQRAGRHAAAERLLRDVSGALARRRAWEPAGRVHIELGRLLLERGRAAAADRTFGEAAQLGEAGGRAEGAVVARIWQALARTDAGRLTDAEAICRAVLLTLTPTSAHEAWVRAALARVLCWQARVEEAVRCQLEAGPLDPATLDPLVAASIDGTLVRTLIGAGDLFQAGLHARRLTERCAASTHPGARLVALTAQLRASCAGGDLVAAGQTLASIDALARASRMPWRALRARLIWCDAVRRAGREPEARRCLARLSRLRRIAPGLLRRALDDRLAATAGVPGPLTRDVPARADTAELGVSLLHLVHGEHEDADALGLVLDRLARDLQAGRVEMISGDAGPTSVIAAAGTGGATRVGRRVLEAGLLLDAEADHGARELGAPVRLGARVLAALVARWPADREPPARAGDVLRLAAAVLAPRMDAMLSAARDQARAAASLPELIGVSAAMSDVRRAIERAARAPFNVLVEGESGVGKELAARAIHQMSARRERRFCDVNCAAFPDELLESELFGHTKGAFTGALADKAGLFEEADGGTLFLDEVPDLSARAQAKLLRAVQQQEVRRVGETFSRQVDVRLVAAANRDLRVEAAAKRFRADLLFRLDVIHIRIPPLRERPEDIPVLVRHFWGAAAERVGCRAVLGHGVLAALARCPWPGNVRELQNTLAALAVAAPARGQVRASLLPAAVTGAAVIRTPKLAEARRQFERRCVEVALAQAGGNRTRAAAALGLSRQGLLKTVARLGLGGDAAP